MIFDDHYLVKSASRSPTVITSLVYYFRSTNLRAGINAVAKQRFSTPCRRLAADQAGARRLPLQQERIT